MTLRKDRLEALVAIAAVLSDRALAPVAAAQARLETARARADGLAASRAQLRGDCCDPVQAAMMARQGEALRRRQATAMTDLARIQAELEIAKAAARPAFGRKIALERLLARMPPGK